METATQGKTNSQTTAKAHRRANRAAEESHNSRSFPIAQRGIKTVGDVAEICSAMIYDVLAGNVEQGQSSQISSFTGKLIGCANLQFRYAMLKGKKGGRRIPILG